MACKKILLKIKSVFQNEVDGAAESYRADEAF